MADQDKFFQTDEQRVVEHNQVNVHLLRLTPLTQPPVDADLKDGDVWATAAGELKIRLGGVTKTVTVT